MGELPKRAFILAAGMGSRLRPHTDTMPKPMVPVGGRAMIDRTLDHLDAIGVSDVTVNIHYMAEKLQAHLAARRHPRMTLSYEPALLDTGGGIKKALYTMGGEPFFCFSGDTLWEDGPAGNTLVRMAKAWDSARMDLMLLLQPVDKMIITHGSNDYDLTPSGHPARSLTTPKSGKYFWPSIRIIHPRLFDDTPEEAFSFLSLMDKAEAAGRLAAVEHDGVCHHISTPDDLARVNAHFATHSPVSGGPKVA